MKQQNWVKYKRKAKSVELNIKDNDGQTIDFFKLQKGNTRDIKRIVNKLKIDYDFDLVPMEVEEKSWIKKDLVW